MSWASALARPTAAGTTDSGLAAACSEALRKLHELLQQEQAARQQLGVEWTQFTPAGKSHCLRLSTPGNDPKTFELMKRQLTTTIMNHLQNPKAVFGNKLKEISHPITLLQV